MPIFTLQNTWKLSVRLVVSITAPIPCHHLTNAGTDLDLSVSQYPLLVPSPNASESRLAKGVIQSHHGHMIEVRCGYKSQKYPIFVRMADKESRWGYDNGLRTIIPTTLTFGILGYPFIDREIF
jgi:hypothetical protein